MKTCKHNVDVKMAKVRVSSHLSNVALIPTIKSKIAQYTLMLVTFGISIIIVYMGLEFIGLINNKKTVRGLKK